MAITPQPGPDEEDSAKLEELARSYAGLINQPGPDDEKAPAESVEQGEEASSPPPLPRIVEALLFVGGPPLSADRAAEAIRGLTQPQFLQAVEHLNRAYRSEGRPYRIRPRGQGFELILFPRYRAIQERLYGSVREARLTPTSLDVLALVAYRQPVTKAEVDALRGADSGAPLRQLVRVGLIVVQRGQADQTEVSYNTTPRFLKMFGLTTLDDLPRTQEPERM